MFQADTKGVEYRITIVYDEQQIPFDTDMNGLIQTLWEYRNSRTQIIVEDLEE